MSSGFHKKSAFFLDFFNIFFNYLNKNAVSSIIYQDFKVFIGDMINSSAEIQPHCLSSSFVLRTKHHLLYAVCKQTA